MAAEFRGVVFNVRGMRRLMESEWSGVRSETSSPPEDDFVVEDAVNGVRVVKAGGMSAQHLERSCDEDHLAEAWAVVMRSSDHVSLDALSEDSLEGMSVR